MKKSPFVITFSGDPVAGKSSAIDALTRKYEQDGFVVGERDEGKCIIRLAAGGMFRNIAEQAGIALSDLNNFAKQRGNSIRKLKEKVPGTNFFDNLSDEILDKSVDSFVDEYILGHIEMLKSKYEGKDDVIIIVDSRIAGLLMKCKGQENMCIRFSTLPEVAAERFVKDAKNRGVEISADNLSDEELYKVALDSVKERTSKERERFIGTYSKDLYDQSENAKVDIQNLDNYDLVINTSGTTIDREIGVLYSCVEKARSGEEFDKLWRSTKHIYPGATQPENIDTSKSPRVFVLKVDGKYYAYHGQEYIGVANHMGYEIEKKTGEESGYPLVPMKIIAKDQQFVFYRDQEGEIASFQADRYVKKTITQEVIKKFENDYGFKYPNTGHEKSKAVENKKRNSGPAK